MSLDISFGKWWPFYLGLNVFSITFNQDFKGNSIAGEVLEGIEQ